MKWARDSGALPPPDPSDLKPPTPDPDEDDRLEPEGWSVLDLDRGDDASSFLSFVFVLSSPTFTLEISYAEGVLASNGNVPPIRSHGVLCHAKQTPKPAPIYQQGTSLANPRVAKRPTRTRTRTRKIPSPRRRAEIDNSAMTREAINPPTVRVDRRPQQHQSQENREEAGGKVGRETRKAR